ncbi:MAG: ThiF family adenylyltransferase [Puniceicoccaceae bacterium]
MAEFLIQKAPIDPIELGSRLKDAAAGAFVSFEGWVRNHHEGRAVRDLHYEAFTVMAEREGAQILEEAKRRFAIIEALGVHRFGRLSIGDCAIWIGVTAAHRQEAFLACRWIMDTIKERLPVWKQEAYEDGSVVWVHASSGSKSEAPSVADDPIYSRQVALSAVGREGQERLAGARVLVVGAGGLGCPLLQYLAAAGVGHLTIIDGDRVERSNLHRQILFNPADEGRYKAAVAGERLRQMNPNLSILAINDPATSENLPGLLKDCDVAVEGTDNFESKYLVHDFAWNSGVPLVQASVYQWDGAVQVFDPGQPENGCFRCLWPQAPPPGAVCNCAEAGILGVTPGTLGMLQATEVLKILLKLPGRLGAETLHVDILSGQTWKIRRSRREGCACQGGEGWPRPVTGLLYPGETARRLKRLATTIDLREASEVEIASVDLERMLLFPSARWGELTESSIEGPVVLCCAGGVRSRKVLEKVKYPKNWYAWTRSIKEWESLE